ncbi:Ig-like domain-containing protein [Hyalangium gracile]|uniref:Ig-like domain-containing protein n=1 Tax=Hyalangium gracile TaxID=394092 RepID=UPI001CC99F3C|nr:Ig-like domain-containing protein [Hyalangium gracile]
MIPTKPLLLSAAVLLTACIKLPEVEDPQAPSDQEPDSGIPPSLTLTLTTPTGTTYTNGTVSVQLQVQGDTPEQVELLVDGQPLTTLAAPYSFNWDTSSVTEGSHKLAARARLGDKTFASEERDVVVDRTPPHVVSRTPTPGAQDIWVRQPIQATFSEPLKPASVTTASVQLAVGGTEAPPQLSLSSDGKTLTVTPAGRLEVPNTVQVTITNGVTDLAGNVLNLPASIWSWSLPLSFPLGNLSAIPGSTDAHDPSLQADALGRLYVSWQEWPSASPYDRTIHVFGLTNTTWEPIGTPIAFTTIIPDTKPDPGYVFRLDSMGNPIIAWSQEDEQTSGFSVNTYIKRWSGNQWVDFTSSPNASLSNKPKTTAFTLTLDSTDKPFLGWTFADTTNSEHSPLTVWNWVGSRWVAYGNEVGTNLPSPFEPLKLLLDATDKPVVAWTEGDIYVRRWTGGDWLPVGSALGAFPDSTAAGLGDMLLDDSDNPIVAWRETDGSTTWGYVARFTGGGWQLLGEPLSAVPGTTSILAPRLQRDPEGNLIVAWAEYSRAGLDAPLQINLRRWTGTAWATIGSPIALSQENVDFLNISFLLDRSGNLYLAWPEKTGSTAKSIRVHRYNY